MTNDIIAGVAGALAQEFGYPVYQNDVAQGLIPPCFLISLLSPSRKPYLGTRQRYDVPLDVLYFPEEAGDNRTLIDVADRLFETLAWIDLPDGDRLRGMDVHFEIQDQVLHFFVVYTLFLRQNLVLPYMEDLKTDVIPEKGGEASGTES